MKNISNPKIGDKVRWFYQIDKWSKPTDEIVYIASEPTSSGTLVRVDRKDKQGEITEGGYIRVDELYEVNDNEY